VFYCSIEGRRQSAGSGYNSVEDVETALSDRFKCTLVALQPVKAGVYVTGRHHSHAGQ